MIRGESLQRSERGWPIPPAAPRTATLAAEGVDVEYILVAREAAREESIVILGVWRLC